jgi:stringent starvation protein B
VKGTSTRPYLLRAIYEWCVDNGYTPYLSVQVDGATRVPLEFVKDGLIVLNIGPNATRNLTMSNHSVEFHTRFNGVSREVSVPVGTIIGIFARENGEGLAFEVERPTEGAAQDSRRVIEGAEDSAQAGATAAPASAAPSRDDDPTGPAGGPPRGKPSLRVIK